jgi:prolyl-tRNA synthetase
VHVVTLGKAGSEERAVSDRIYDELREAGLQTLYDDRDAGPGEKFADAELLGCPLRVTVGRKALQAGELEVQIRRGRESGAVPLDGAVAAVVELWRGLP